MLNNCYTLNLNWKLYFLSTVFEIFAWVLICFLAIKFNDCFFCFRVVGDQPNKLKRQKEVNQQESLSPKTPERKSKRQKLSKHLFATFLLILLFCQQFMQ